MNRETRFISQQHRQDAGKKCIRRKRKVLKSSLKYKICGLTLRILP